jgi:hypothetical protein
MEYKMLILVIGLLAIFTWILIRNRKRTGVIYTLFRIDTIVGVLAGLYFVLASVKSLLLD